VKKLIGIGLMAGALFAFPGMRGMGSMGSGLSGAPVKGLKDSTVLATVNGKKITVKDMNIYLQGITVDNRMKLQELPAQHIKQFVDQYIETLELYPKAKEVQKMPQFKIAQKQMTVAFWHTQAMNSIKISDKEAKEFYEKYKDVYFKTTPKVKARHILVKDKKTAEKLINELKGLKGKALENKFASLAKKYSKGPSKVSGGELGWFEPKEMVKPFADAVKSMSAGELTLKPVKTRFGWHIILVEDKNSKAYTPFKKVKEQIVAYLKQLKMKEEIKKIKSHYKVEYSIPKH